jgi:hypothetical protein
MNTLALANSATLALSTGTKTVSAATGVIVLLLGWFAHHKLAHRHPRMDVFAKLLVAAGATIVFASAGASIVQRVNSWTVGPIAALWRDAHLGSWPSTIGLLTLVEVVLLLWVGIHLYDAVRGKRGGGGSGGAASAGSGRGPAGSGRGPAGSGRTWAWLEHQFHKFGYFAVGPLTVTLPATVGALAAVPFALLAGFVGHLVGAPFGLG